MPAPVLPVVQTWESRLVTEVRMRPEHALVLLLQLHAKGAPLPPLSPHGPMSTSLLDLGPTIGLNRIFAGFLSDKVVVPLMDEDRQRI